ncbi:hypothetical protein PENTCL1PPCAC_5095, partial [Pristionchus entomophagus]
AMFSLLSKYAIEIESGKPSEDVIFRREQQRHSSRRSGDLRNDLSSRCGEPVLSHSGSSSPALDPVDSASETSDWLRDAPTTDERSS